MLRPGSTSAVEWLLNGTGNVRELYGTIFFVKKDMQQQQIMRFRFRFKFLGENIPKILSMCNSGFSTISVTRLKNTKMLVSPELLDILAWNKHCYDCFQEVFWLTEIWSATRQNSPQQNQKHDQNPENLHFTGSTCHASQQFAKNIPNYLNLAQKYGL